jgi:hypothetical protein
MTTFLRLLASKNKGLDLISGCNALRENRDIASLYHVDPKSFKLLPGAPFAYWVSEEVRHLFAQLPPLEGNGRSAQHGGSSKDDFRFLRVWWEPQGENNKWNAFAKGGKFSQYHSDVFLVINWQNDAKELEAALLKKYPYLGETANWVLHRECRYGDPGLTWPRRPTRGGCFSVLPQGCIFSENGPSVFVANNSHLDLFTLLGIANSRAFNCLVQLLFSRGGEGSGQTMTYEVGYVGRTPFPRTSELDAPRIAELSREAWQLSRQLSEVSETSHAFALPSALSARTGVFEAQVIKYRLARIQTQIDEIAFDLYGFSDADRAAALASSGSTDEDTSGGAEDADDSEDDDSAIAIDQTDGLLSWSAGVAFGRFDWRLATGERAAPPEPEPFDPLPSKSPGMLADDAEPFHAHFGILVDDQGHPNDLARLIEEVLARVEAPVPADVRRWLQRDFFPFHHKQYSKSRRKAPIYWPISTISGSYALWLYYPSLTGQTLYTAANDFVEPKLKQVGQDVAALRSKGSARSRDDEKTFEALQTLELELIELRDTLLQIAPTYRPNHDDGVQITAAPLWQLFRHKPWQKVLKDTWAKLEKGDYDWAHLAMSYWPDRVSEKCKTDKSLAIAHNLEHLYIEPEPKPTKGRSRKKGE